MSEASEAAQVAAAKIRTLARGRYRASALYFLLHSGVVDLLNKSDRGLHVSEMCTALNLKDEEYLLITLRALACDEDGWVEEKSDGTFASNPMTKALGGEIRWSILHLWEKHTWNALGAVSDRMANGKEKSPFEIANGLNVFQHYEKDQEAGTAFNNAMSFYTRMSVDSTVQYDFGRFQHVVDIGGSQGILLEGIAKKYPGGPKLTLFDLPDVVPKTNDHPFSIVKGDFFKAETIPKGADAYVMKSILHDWSDDHCKKILANIASVMDEKGSIILVETILPEMGDNSNPDSKWLSFWMATVTVGGQERTKEHWSKLVESVGLKLVSTQELGRSFAIEIKKKS